MRRERQRKAARRSNLITIGIAFVIVAGVTAIIVTQRTGEGDSEVPAAPAGAAASAAGCDGIQEHEIEGRDHVDEGTDVDYKTIPPTSGNHWPPGAQADAGFYTDTVEDERLVHNMEHGQIVIWYSPDAGKETIDGIKGLVESADDADIPENEGGARSPLIAVPYDQVPDDKSYAITAWGASQACSKYSEDAINAFREKYQGRAPEPVALPFSG